jgi:hypothetical protein
MVARGWCRLTGVIIEPPRTVKNTGILRSEVTEKTSRKVKPAVWAPHTFVHNGGLGSFAPIGDGDGLETLRTRETSTKLGDVEGDNEVARRVILPASTQANVIKGEA